MDPPKNVIMDQFGLFATSCLVPAFFVQMSLSDTMTLYDIIYGIVLDDYFWSCRAVALIFTPACTLCVVVAHCGCAKVMLLTKIYI